MTLIDLHNRVAQSTAEKLNQKIERSIRKNIFYYAHNPEQIEPRIQELKKEWDIERALEMNASLLALAGLLFGVFSRKQWILLLPLVVLSFLVQHAIQGWCPPVEIFRRLQIRTKEEIMREYVGLLAIKGDLDKISESKEKPPKERADSVLHALAA